MMRGEQEQKEAEVINEQTIREKSQLRGTDSNGMSFKSEGGGRRRKIRTSSIVNCVQHGTFFSHRLISLWPNEQELEYNPSFTLS